MRYGHFDNEKREYVIDRVDLPTSWTNYLGVKDTCVVVNHTAGGYMFYKTPEYHRVTRFRGNSVPMDRPGHYVYVRDNDNGDYFSISWQPVGKPLDKAKYKCRHGLSYSVYECEYDKEHESFISRKTNKPYMEAHHLIPMEFQRQFIDSIDIEENIICLCSRCHNKLHYGVHPEKII